MTKSKLLLQAFLAQAEKEDPCWDGYEMVGTKDKNGKKVPNCVPKKANALIKDFLKQADNRALRLEEEIKDSNETKSGKKYWEPAGTNDQPRDKGIKPLKPAFKSASVIDKLIQKAYGVTPGGSGMSGGNFSMGPKFDATSTQTVAPGEGASDPTFKYKTKDKPVPKKQMQPGMEPVIPGQTKEQNRYTGPEQRVVQKPDSNVKMKTSYDKTPLNQEVNPGQSRLEQLYPSLFQDKKPSNTLQNFTDWLKGKHEKYFGGGAEKPQSSLTDWLWNKKPAMEVQQSQNVVSLVKTAMLDSDGNDFELILTALHKMKISDENILNALGVV